MTQRRPSIPRHTAFWLIGAAGLFLLLWLLSGVLLPFVLGMGVAYLCDPIADRLETIGVRRWIATLIILMVFVGVGIAVLIVILPLLQDQFLALAEHIPRYVDVVRQQVLPELTQWFQRVSGDSNSEEVRKVASNYASEVSSWFVGLLGGVWVGGLAIMNVFYVMLLTPLVAYYFLRDWDGIVARINDWLPRRQAETIRQLAREIDAILAGFVRGQAIVCVLFAVYYAGALTAAGLNFGLIIGLAAGFLTFIPYLGAILGLVVSLAVAFAQFDDYSRIAIVAAVYVLGHMVEGNLVTPNLVGDRVGLHPVWVIFALMAGGALFGFTGILLAVPTAAVIGVLVRFSLRQYLASSFYDNRAEPEPAEPSV